MSSELKNLSFSVLETPNYEEDVKEIIRQSRLIAYQSVNIVLLRRNWLIGKRIHDEELKNTRKENYGLDIIKNLSKTLSEDFGKGFGRSNLYSFYSFYKTYPNIFQSVIGQSFDLLSWTHYSVLIGVFDQDARLWYEKECKSQNWSVRTLKRNVSSQYYYRLLKTNELAKAEREEPLTYEQSKLEFIKNPVIFEFLGIPQDEKIHESELESLIITNLRDTLLELGKGYAFIGRQYHIHTEKKDYFIDLVFYNFILKCFILIDLKTSIISHKDVGQMDMYVRMFDELKKDKSDNPTLGIVLCSETDEDIARYSILKGNEQLFASKYKLYLPSEEVLLAEIKHQKELFLLSHPDKQDEDEEDE